MIEGEKKVHENKPREIVGRLNSLFDKLDPSEIHNEWEMEVPEEILTFCEKVEAVGGRALLVGGSVRDMIRSKMRGGEKIKPKDIDMEIYGIEPADILTLVDEHFKLEEAGTFGQKFEVIKIFGRGRYYDIDISSPRDDNKTGTGSKGFEATSHPEFTIKEAARRRDLTCNSVSYDPLLKLTYDPFCGVEDIRNNVLRATDFDKFPEDPVRIWRLVQFIARSGGIVDKATKELAWGMLDKKTATEVKNKRIIIGGTQEETDRSLGLIDRAAVELDQETHERVYGEFHKLLAKGVDVSLGLELAREIGLIDRYFPWLAELTITEQDNLHHPEGTAWKHTLQVVDAAAAIAIREKMSEEDRFVLVLAALCHDLGKSSKTKKTVSIDEQGKEITRISSAGHDEESGILFGEFFDLNFAPKGNKNFAEELKASIKVLAEEHMRPFQYYEDYLDGQSSKRKLGRLARRLRDGHTNMQTLSFLAEADQRGRNASGDKPNEREEVEKIGEWQPWLKKTCEELGVLKEMPEKLLKGEMIIQEFGIEKGPLLGLLLSWVYDDQTEGVVKTVEEALARVEYYAKYIEEHQEELIVFVREQRIKLNEPEMVQSDKKKAKDVLTETLVYLKKEGVKEELFLMDTT